MRKKPSKLAVVWFNMRKRCYSPSCPSYKYYGGRGIRICDEWKSRKAFEDWAIRNGYAEGLQIDRIDNNGDYTPQNCRFVSPKTNANNRRNPNVTIGVYAKAAKPICYDGKTTTIAELSRQLGIPYQTIRNRLLTNRDLRTGKRLDN